MKKKPFSTALRDRIERLPFLKTGVTQKKKILCAILKVIQNHGKNDGLARQTGGVKCKYQTN